MTKKLYGITIKQRLEPQRPVEMRLTGSAGSRGILRAAKRVIATRDQVIKALAKR